MVHLQDNDYDVEKIDMSNDELAELKQSKGIPAELSSCHTAEIGGYIIEGHVPANVIEKLLVERPEIVGLAVPGMPPEAPGMGGEPQGSLKILAFDQEGQVWVYTTW